MVENFGVAFGIPISGWWLQALLLVVVVYLWISGERRLKSGLVLVIIGGASNLVERVFSGKVVDILEIPLIHLWINWADILITIGCIIYIWQNQKYFTKIKTS